MLLVNYVSQRSVNAYLERVAERARVKAERTKHQSLRTGATWPQHMTRAEVNSQSFQDDVQLWLKLKRDSGV